MVMSGRSFNLTTFSCAVDQYSVHILSQVTDFLNQRKGENDRRKDFMINLNGRMMPNQSIEPATGT